MAGDLDVAAEADQVPIHAAILTDGEIAARRGDAALHAALHLDIAAHRGHVAVHRLVAGDGHVIAEARDAATAAGGARRGVGVQIHDGIGAGLQTVVRRPAHFGARLAGRRTLG